MWSSTQHARAMKKMMLAIALMLFILPFGVEAAEESHSAPGQEGSGEGGEHGEEGHPPSDAVLYLFVAILLGVFSRLLLSWTKLPYTGILLIWGIILGVIFEETTRWKYLGDGIEIWTGMDPNLFLLVFLPMLLFSSAFSMDWHIFKKVSGQALLLAVPGVIIGMCLTALVVKGVFPYDWSWKQAFLFGSIYSATDPVAVVAILHEVGASKKLGHVIEGESLLNDGSAYVFFLIFLEAVRGSDRSIGSYIGYFFELSLGAVGIGIGFGIVLMITLTRVFQDSIAEVVLIIAGAYMTYYVAEDLAEVAAVLATVCMGITMMAFGKPAISPNTSHPLHVVLESLEFVANTAVFVYSGTIIATRFGKYQTDDGEDEELDAKDVGYAFLMYIFGLIIRCIIIGVLFPILKRTGYGMTWKEAVVAVWSGLRGAVGLALALIVDLDLPGTVFSGQVLLFVGTTAVLTILVQGTSMPYLLQWLGMTDPSPAKLSMTLMVSREMEEFAEKRLSHLHRDSLLGDPDWEKVKAYTRINAEKLLPKRLRQKKPQPTLLERWMACLACCCRRGADVGVAADQEGGKGAEEGGKTAASPRQVKAEAGMAVELAAAGAPNLQMMSMHAADMGGLVMPSIYSTPSVGSGGMRSLQHSRTSIRSSHDLDELVAQRPAGADAPPMGPARSLLDSGRLKPTVSKQPDVEDIVEEMESELAEESQRDETVLDESPFGEGAGGGRKERAAPVLSRAGTFTNLQKASLVRLPTLAQEAVSQEEMLQEARTRLLHGMRAQYKEARERGYIGEELLVLEESISEALDHVDQPICDFQVLARSLALPRWMKWLVGMLAHWGLEHLSNWLVYQSLSLGTSALASYFHAHRKVQRELLEVIEQLHSLWLASKDKQILQQVRVLATVMHESKEEQAQASSVLVKTRAAYPLVVRAIRTRDVSKYVLLSQMTFVEDLSAAGFLDETEVDQLCKLLHEKAKRLYFHPPSVAFPSMTKRLHSHVLFDQLDDRTFADEVWAAGRAAIFDEGDILPNAVDPAEVLVVLRGICRHKNGHNYASSGHVFGLSNMMLGRTCVPEDAGDLVAESGVLLFRMPRAKMQELHHHHPSILEATWCVVAAEAAPHLDERRFGSTVSTELIHFFRNAEVHYARDNSWLEVPIMTEAILLAGAVLVSATSAARTGPCILDAGVYKCSGNVTVVQIPTGTPHLPVLQVTIPSFN